jgi:predicted nucleotidyltransferase
MTSAATLVAPEDIEAAVARIAAHFAPRQVWLFGSYAYGTPTTDSDVDLLVIMDTNLRPVEQAVEIRAVVQFPFPVDLLVRTPEQLAARLDLGDDFFRDVITRGTVMYEVTDARVDREG